MIPKIKNQEQYDKVEKYFVEKYWNNYLESEADAIDLEKFYIKARNDFNDRLNFLQTAFPIGAANIFVGNWIYHNNSKKLFKTNIEITEIFCKENNCRLHDIAITKAEFVAIQIVFDKAFHTIRTNTKVEYLETFDELIKGIEAKENNFCKAMPIKFAIEHFNVFIETSSNNGKPFLTREQFISFLKRALLNDSSINKITLNIGNGENYFVIKRFYEFYTLASNEFEKTKKCKDKYIKLITDNFNNWDYEKLVNNFANKTKRNW